MSERAREIAVRVQALPTEHPTAAPPFDPAYEIPVRCAWCLHWIVVDEDLPEEEQEVVSHGLCPRCSEGLPRS